MTTVAIMQPTYLPWLGYFDLIDRSDIFVFLNSVQFDKRSWQQRNRIKTPNGELMLTVPVLTKGKFKQKIYDVEIDKSKNFAKKHFNSISSNYKKSKYFKSYINELDEIYNSKINKLSDLNIRLIKWLSSKLGIKTEFVLSSQLDEHGSKTELLLNICKKKKNLFEKSGIQLSYQNYKHPTYKQLFGDFIPYMSVIDLLFCEGNKSLEIISSGRVTN